MAYVFGIGGIPIFEMLFIISVLLLAGLIFVLLELRKLTWLISKETFDLKRFEDDINKLETGKGKKSSEDIINYVKDAISEGVSVEQIESSLVKHGWPKEEIRKILAKLKRI